MAHARTNLFYHLVWSTKKRLPLIYPENKQRLYGYLKKIALDEDTEIMNINGMPDHVHLVVRLSQNVLLPEFIRRLKMMSTKWVRRTFPKMEEFAWQSGYGAFTVSLSMLDQVNGYVDHQEKHHEKLSYRDEFKRFLESQKIPFDERLFD